jgi:hypothetical protein
MDDRFCWFRSDDSNAEGDDGRQSTAPHVPPLLDSCARLLSRIAA